MVTITLYARQQKRHRCIEQSFGLCGRGRGGAVAGKGLILPRGGNHVGFLELRRDSRVTTGHFISFSSFATTLLKGISSLTCLLSHLLLTPHPDTIRLMLPLLDQIHLSLRLSITLMLNLMVTCLFSYSFLNSIQCIIQYSSSLPS